MESVKIKDFIIDTNKINDINKETKQKVKKSKIQYKIVTENDMDFVINRKSKASDKDLVFLVSQDMYYIKDNKTDTIQLLDEDNCRSKISAFQRDNNGWVNFEKVKWTKYSYTEGRQWIITNYNNKYARKNIRNTMCSCK